MRRMLLLLFAMLFSAAAFGLPMDSIRARLERGPVQEKVYLHLDNQSYFVGDTIWYKAYVVRADDLKETDMSRVLYVELLTPDGLLVERQQLIVSPDGYSCGDFAIGDSLYSGYYELRAYTRWMLNFNVTIRKHRLADKERFYEKQMAEDFYREYGNIYSRVFPVYVKPEKEGDWADKAIYQRPKQRLDKELDESLRVEFFPEGGNLVEGHRQRVAFEATDEDGQAVEVSGKIGTTDVKTEFMGRGLFEIDVSDDLPKATFDYNGKQYKFSLPKPKPAGAVVRVEGSKAVAEGSGTMAVAILCRGKLQCFQTFTDRLHIDLDGQHLPTGVNDLLVIDTLGNILADRLFFVNNHDRGGTISVEGLKDEYKPFEQISLTFTCPDVNHFSVAVRDGANDAPTFDDGNLLTDLLLSSELKGFVANPAYYFEKGHEHHLDLLMMVQGWRRYDAKPILGAEPLRYRPEGGMTVEGYVYDFDRILDQSIGEVLKRMNTSYESKRAAADVDLEAPVATTQQADNSQTANENGLSNEAVQQTETSAGNAETEDNGNRKLWHHSVKDSVILHGELILGRDIATVDITTTRNGHYAFDIPPFYGDATLSLSATNPSWSKRKQKRISNKGIHDDSSAPEYFVKRDIFFPIFSKKYTWYQCHQPEVGDTIGDYDYDDASVAPISKMDSRIKEVTVKGKRRRIRRPLDFAHPAMIYDAAEMYNLILDYGLSGGYVDIAGFPHHISYLLMANYDGGHQIATKVRMVRPFHIYEITKDGNTRATDSLYYDIYELTYPGGGFQVRRSEAAIAKDLSMKRINKVRLFTDFEPRNPEKPLVRSISWADVTLDFVVYPDEMETYTFRDRHITLHGFTAPHDYYNPDYSRKPMPDTKDYRRTLYWEPNAKPDADGHFNATFYNNGKPTRPKVNACGIGTTGKLMYSGL